MNIATLKTAEIFKKLPHLWIPSFDEIAERRAIAEKYGVDVKRVDGKNLVHIMSQKCYSLNGSNVRDWCVIDPK